MRKPPYVVKSLLGAFHAFMRLMESELKQDRSAAPLCRFGSPAVTNGRRQTRIQAERKELRKGGIRSNCRCVKRGRDTV